MAYIWGSLIVINRMRQVKCREYPYTKKSAAYRLSIARAPYQQTIYKRVFNKSEKNYFYCRAFAREVPRLFSIETA